MRTTLNIDDELLKQASQLSGLKGKTAVVREGLKALIERESARDKIDPMALYRSYFRRQLAADFRIVAGRPGPRRTAEAYMMIYLLNNQDTIKTLP